MKFSYCRNTTISRLGEVISLTNFGSGNKVDLSIDCEPIVDVLGYAPQSIPQIVERLQMIYPDVDKAELSRDMESLIAELVNAGILEESMEPKLRGVQINLTERCNERCLHCYIPIRRRTGGKSLSINDCKGIIDDLVLLEGKDLVLSGGELFLYRDLIKLMKYANSKRLNIVLLSNLVLLNDSILEAIIDCQVKCVQTSLYSTNPNEHDNITGINGSCEKTMNSIRRLRRHNVNVMISCIVMKQNLNSFTSVLDFASEVGASSQCSCNIVMDLDFGRKNEQNRLDIDEVKLFYWNLMQYHHNRGDKDFSLSLRELRNEQYKYPIWFQEQHPCGSDITLLSVNGNGDVCPCSLWEKPFGNIHTRSLKDIWTCSDGLAEHLSLKNKMLGLCANCKYVDYCASCPATKYNENSGVLDCECEAFCQNAKAAYIVEQQFKNQKC